MDQRLPHETTKGLWRANYIRIIRYVFVPFDQKFWYCTQTWDEDSDFLDLHGFEWPAPYKIDFRSPFKSLGLTLRGEGFFNRHLGWNLHFQNVESPWIIQYLPVPDLEMLFYWVDVLPWSFTEAWERMNLHAVLQWVLARWLGPLDHCGRSRHHSVTMVVGLTWLGCKF